MKNTHNDDEIFIPAEDSLDEEVAQEDNDDITLEEDTEGTARDTVATVKKLKERLAVCTKEKEEYLNGWQRARADFANVKRDEDAHRVETVKLAKEAVFLDILPVLDSFDMAMGNKEAWEKVDQNWRKGVEYIYAQLRSALEQNGITEINPLGKPFDHHEQMSLEMVPTANKEENDKVIEVTQKGYKIHDKVIRPARVKVAVHEEKASGAE